MNENLKNILIKYLVDKLGEYKQSFSQLRWNCPNCDSNKKFNLEISLLKMCFNCWSCHYSGTLRQLLKDYAIDDSWKQLPEFINQTYHQYKKEKTQSNILFPENTIPFYLNNQVLKYLTEERKIEFMTLSQRNVRYCFHPDDPYYDCILFPFYDEQKNIIAFCSHNMKTKKYKNTGQLNFVAYKEFINTFFPIIITEGIYDALSVPNAIPLLGTNINHEIYRFCKDKKIILALDNDDEVSVDYKNNILKKMQLYGAKLTTIFDLNQYKDLNEYLCQNINELKQRVRILFELLNVV